MTIAEFIESNKDSSDRYELVKGEPIKMMSTTIFHEWLISKISSQLQEFLKDESCTVFGSGFSIRISDDTFRMPDVSIVCDFCNIKKNDEVIFNGIPELVIEVKSKGNSKRDLDSKKKEYLSIEIPQYWIIYNEYRAEINILRNKKYDTFTIVSNEDTGNLCIPLTIKNKSTLIVINPEEIPEVLRTNILYKFNPPDVEET